MTIAESKHTVSQAYCSAMPVAYSSQTSQLWSAFAKLILQASYEATVCAGILNYIASGNKTLYLTLIGGGVFGNEKSWIMDAIYQALIRYKDKGLDVAIVSRGQTDHFVQKLINKFESS